MKGSSNECILSFKSKIDTSIEDVHFVVSFDKKGKRSIKNVKIAEINVVEIIPSENKPRETSIKIEFENNLFICKINAYYVLYDKNNFKLLIFNETNITIYKIESCGLVIDKKINATIKSYSGFDLYSNHLVLYTLDAISALFNI